MYPRLRRLSRSSFFLLFLLAPVLDLFRLDLNQGHFIILGIDWTLGLRGSTLGTAEITWQLALRLLIPVLLTVALLFWVVWRWGRIYCGWLCPHFSMVEWIDQTMDRWLGRRSLWEPVDGVRRPMARAVVAVAVVSVSFLWAITLLSYLVTPIPLWQGLFSLELPRWNWIFLTAATLAFAVEFTLARHFFCKFGCAVGIFQSLIWMLNRRSMIVGFSRERARDCRDCSACDRACPMRLKPRGMKRHKITCTQCGVCIQTCSQVQANNPQGSLLHWRSGDSAVEMDHQPRVHLIPVKREE